MAHKIKRQAWEVMHPATAAHRLGGKLNYKSSKPNKIFIRYMLLILMLAAAILAITILPYFGLLAANPFESEFSKEVTADWMTPNVTTHIDFGSRKPASCSESVVVLADNSISIPFEVTNASYVKDRCAAADITWQNLIWQPNLQLVFTEPPNGSVIAQNWTIAAVETSAPADLVLLEWTFNNTTWLEPMAGWGTTWSYSLTNLSEGSYTIRAIATDSLNRTAASDSIQFNVDYTAGSLRLEATRTAVNTIRKNITYTVLWGGLLMPNMLIVRFVPPTPANNANVKENWTFINVSTSYPVNNALLNWSSIIENMSGNGSSWWLNKTNLSEGIYTYQASAENASGELRTLTIGNYRKAPPSPTSFINRTKRPGFAWAATGEIQNAYFEDIFGADSGVEFELAASTVNWQFKNIAWSNTASNQIMINSASHVPAEIRDRTVHYANVLDGIGFDYTYLPGLLKENITITNASALPTLSSQPDANTNLDFEFKLQHTADLDIVVNNNKWDNNSELITDQPVFFYKGDSNVAFFAKPFAVDAAGNTTDATYKLKKAGSEIFISIETPFAWLNDSARIWPVTIDPTMSSALWNVSDVMAIAVSTSYNTTALGGAGANATIVLGEPAIGLITGGYSACLGWFCTSYDVTGPVVGTPTFNTSNNPTNKNTSIQVNATWTDDLGVVSCDYNLNSGSWTAMTIYNNTPSYMSGTASAVIAGPLTDGNYTVTVRCTDTSGNIGSNSAVLTIDIVKPPIIFVSPTDSDASVVDRNWTYVNATVNGTGSAIDTCLLEWNATTNYTMTKVGSGEFVSCWYNKTALSDGDYTYRIFANDSAGNMNNTANRSITIVATPYAPTLTAPKCYELTGEWFNSSVRNITLAGGTTKTILCNTTASDRNGAANINGSSIIGVFYHAPTVSYNCSSDTRRCYINTTCSNTTASSTSQVLTCYFNLWYHADNTTTSGNWTAQMNVSDYTSNLASNASTDLICVEVLVAINTSAQIYFSTLPPGNISVADVNATVQNFGNVRLNLQLNGTSLSGAQCTGLPIGVTSVRYNCTAYAQDYSTAMKSLTANLADTNCNFALDYNSTATSPPNATSKNLPWKIQVPQAAAGNCTGTVWLVAAAG